MPCSHGDLSHGVPASFLAWGSSGQSPQRKSPQEDWWGDVVAGGLLTGGDAHSVWLSDLANIVVSGVLCILNLNRNYWTLSKWLSSSAVSLSDGSPPQFGVSSCGCLGAGPWCKMSPGCGWWYGCWDKQHRSSAFEVGTDDWTGKIKKKAQVSLLLKTTEGKLSWCAVTLFKVQEILLMKDIRKNLLRCKATPFNYHCCDKRHVLSWQTHKTFVTTKMILVAAPTNDIQCPRVVVAERHRGQTPIMTISNNLKLSTITNLSCYDCDADWL